VLMIPFKRLLTYVKRYKVMLLFGILALVAANLLKAAVPLAIQRSVDALEGRVTHSQLLRYSVMVIALGLLQSGFVFAQSRLLLGAAHSVERDMRNSFYEHLQKLSLEFFQLNRTGELMTHATRDIVLAANASTEALIYSVNTIVALVIILPLMALLSWRLTLLAFAPMLLVLIATLVFQRPMIAGYAKVSESYARMCAQAHEALCAVKTVRAYLQEGAALGAFTNLSRQCVGYQLGTVRLFNLLNPLLQFFIGLSLIAVLWYGGDLTAAGTLSMGQFLEFILYVGYLAWPMHALGQQLTVLQRGVVSMRRVDSVLSLEPAIRDPLRPAAVSGINGTLEFRNVTFKYKGMEKPAIDGISFRIDPGQIVGLAGLVGSGKSTLMSMVPRLRDPCSGDVLIDGRSVRDFPLKVLRSSIGYVPQETFLFSDTIAANIAFGSSQASQEGIEQAAADSGVDSDIAAFSQGYDTPVGERGVTLSGGQKQRISIARAILLHPPILLLDDALSSVDSYTEEKILARLRKRMRGKICLISSHRISTLRRADVIIVLHDGRVVEQGTHERLLERGGLYSEIYATELLEENLVAG
jgi:ATP-binding cassette, subfamily B, multidrug efflux pump